MSQEQAAQDKAKIWAQLDQEDNGQAPVVVDLPAADEPVVTPQQTDSQEAASTVKTPAVEAGDKEEAVPAVDPYAGMSQAAKDEILGLKTIVGQLSTRLRNAEGHVGGLNNQVKQFTEAAKTTAARGGDAPSAQELKSAQANPEAMARLIDEYPEFGAVVKGALDEEVRALREEIKRLAPQQQTQGVTAQDLAAIRSDLTIENKHAGWQTTVTTPAFQGWLQRQPREVQMLAASDSPQDAIRLLDLHKEGDTGSQTRNQRLESAAALPTGRSSSEPRAKPIAQMTKAEYWRHLDQLDKQKAA
jgi:hypothetical protein